MTNPWTLADLWAGLTLVATLVSSPGVGVHLNRQMTPASFEGREE